MFHICNQNAMLSTQAPQPPKNPTTHSLKACSSMALKEKAGVDEIVDIPQCHQRQLRPRFDIEFLT